MFFPSINNFHVVHLESDAKIGCRVNGIKFTLFSILTGNAVFKPSTGLRIFLF